METTDIVITTRGRLEYLIQTVCYIFGRTRSPYRLHIIDDATNNDAHYGYLLSLQKAGIIDTLVLHGSRRGLRANQNVGFWLTFSDPFVMTDDDVLCPEVEPDWLSCGLTEMERLPQLGILALNNPADNVGSGGGQRRRYDRDGDVQFCNKVGGTFCFVRRKVWDGWCLPHNRGEKVHSQFNRRRKYPALDKCDHALKMRLKVGYLIHTFCQHIGNNRARDGKHKDMKHTVVGTLDPLTLRPSQELVF